MAEFGSAIVTASLPALKPLLGLRSASRDRKIASKEVEVEFAITEIGNENLTISTKMPERRFMSAP
jgi:hypothetical protein